MTHRIRTNLHRNPRRTFLAALVGVLVVLASAAWVQAATSPDFSLSAAPTSQAVGSGSSTSYVVQLTPANGFSGLVSLSAGSLPKGTSASWTVGSSTSSSSSATVSVPAGSRGVAATLTIGGGQPSAGSYSPTVSATSGSLSHTATLNLTVLKQNDANFSLSATPGAQSIVQGATASSTISISRTNWSGAVSFGAVSGLPTGATASLGTASTSGASDSLSITAGPSTPAGLYTVTVPATGALSGSTASTRYASFTLLVSNATGLGVGAPSADATNSAIAPSAISASLTGATADASGTVTFKVFGPQATAPSSCSTGGTTVGTASVGGPGTVHPSAGFTPTTAGTYWWYASYTGDTYNNGSTSPCGSAMTSTTVKNTTAATASAPASAPATAAIAASSLGSALSGATGNATGTITYKVFGPQSTAPSTCATGGTTVGTASVNGNATYHPTSGFTPAVGGTYWWYASYSGDALNSASASPCGSGMASTAVADFTVAGGPASQTALSGGTSDDSASYTATISSLGGFSGNVGLSTTGLPGGVSSSFSPSSTSSSSSLTLDVGTGVTPGSYPFKVQGTATVAGTTITREASLTLVVQGSQPLRISGDVPSPLYPGAATQQFTVTLTNPNPFSVHFNSQSVSVQPANSATCSASWFQVQLPSVPGGGISVGANGGSATETATAKMLDVNQSQDGCQGQKLTLVYGGSYGK